MKQIELFKEPHGYYRFGSYRYLCVNTVAKYFGCRSSDMEDVIVLKFTKTKKKDSILFLRKSRMTIEVEGKEHTIYPGMGEYLDEIGIHRNDSHYVTVMV